MHKQLVSLFIATSVMVCCTYGQSVEPSKPEVAPEKATSKWELGTRSTYYVFRDNTKGKKFDGSYVGSLYELKDDQNYWPIKLFAQYMVCPYLGVGASYEHVEAVTWDGGGTDGTVELSGPVFYLTGRLPDYNLIRPYAEIGLAYLQSSFDYDPTWYAQGRHEMELEDYSLGLSVALGADVLLTDYWSVNLLARYTEASVDAQVYTYGKQTDHGNFAMDYFTFGLGAKYAF